MGQWFSAGGGRKDHIRTYIHKLLALQNKKISEGKEFTLLEKVLPVILIFLSLPLFWKWIFFVLGSDLYDLSNFT